MSRGNLTVEFIRHDRFGGDLAVSPAPQRFCRPGTQASAHMDPSPQDTPCRRVDRVELSPEALASGPWAVDAAHSTVLAQSEAASASESNEPQTPLPPRTITPVVGSSALAGLGQALVVPGTLLDVVA